MARAAFITLHGIDGSGKSEAVGGIVQHFALKGLSVINYDLYKVHDPNNPFEHIKGKVEKTASPPAQFVFYVASMIYHSHVIRELLSKGNIVVRSRYIQDVLAQYLYKGVQNVQEIVKLASILEPDLSVILTVDEEIRRQRIVQRGEINDKDREEKNPASRLAFFEKHLLASATSRSFIINTSLLSIEQVVETITLEIEMRSIVEA